MFSVSVEVRMICKSFSSPVRDPHQQPQGDHAAVKAETSQHRGAQRGGCRQPSAEVLAQKSKSAV